VPPSSNTLAFHFKSADHARIFAHRLALTLSHVAMLVDGSRVLVINGGEDDQLKEIYRLALMSRADPW